MENKKLNINKILHDKYIKNDVINAFKITGGYFNQLVKRKQIVPSMAATGTGYRNQFTFRDMVKIAIFFYLKRSRKMSNDLASRIAFSSFKTSTGLDIIRDAIKEVVYYREYDHASLSCPDPVCIMFYEDKNGGFEVRPINLRESISNAKIGSEMLGRKDIHILNISEIVKDVLDILLDIK